MPDNDCYVSLDAKFGLDPDFVQSKANDLRRAVQTIIGALNIDGPVTIHVSAGDVRSGTIKPCPDLDTPLPVSEGLNPRGPKNF